MSGEPKTPTLEEFLIRDNAAMRRAGCELAEAALRVIREYDGTHRLALAAAAWTQTIADEGGRGGMHSGVRVVVRDDAAELRAAVRERAEAHAAVNAGMDDDVSLEDFAARCVRFQAAQVELRRLAASEGQP